jgi:integrase
VLVSNSIDVKTAQVRLGHANPALTLKIYAQATTEQDRTAAVMIDSSRAWPRADRLRVG